MPHKLILFDIDGTLLLSKGAGPRAMLQAGQRLFGESFIFEVNTAGKIDTQIFAELVGLNSHLSFAHEQDRFRDSYLELLTQELGVGTAYTLPGVLALLATLREKNDVTLGLLSGNYSLAAPIKLRAAGLEPDWFPVTAFGDEAETRAGLVPVAMRKYEGLSGTPISTADVIIVGDTPLDVACAHDNGCVAVAVATGQFSKSELLETGADLVLGDLSDPSPLFILLEKD